MEHGTIVCIRWVENLLCIKHWHESNMHQKTINTGWAAHRIVGGRSYKAGWT